VKTEASNSDFLHGKSEEDQN